MKEKAKNGGSMKRKVLQSLGWVLPILVPAVLWLLPYPSGLEPHAYRFFALFVGVIVGLALEPLPGAAIGIIAVVVTAVLSPLTLFSTEQTHAAGFDLPGESFKWAVSGFSNSTVWLIFGAFMFAKAYEKTGLGRRIALLMVKYLGKRTITLGYAIMAADLTLAPFTPSNTARSGGTIYPIISNLPQLYKSSPGQTARRAGSYLMWVAIASTCVTSSLFLSALAPNVLSVAIIKDTLHLDISWGQWFLAFLPVGLILLLSVPLLSYWLYPPEVRQNEKVPQWAAEKLQGLGSLTRNEIILLCSVIGALILWIVGGSFIDPAVVALLVIMFLLCLRVLEWDDIIGNKAAWSTFVWFATLIALANGLQKTGFITWLGSQGRIFETFNPNVAAIVLLVAFFLLHYLFASTTAHTTALLPLMLPIASGIPGLNMTVFCLLLATSLGIMGIITPYGTGPSPIYYGSGFLPAKTWWKLGAIFGAIFLLTLVIIGYPWMLFVIR